MSPRVSWRSVSGVRVSLSWAVSLTAFGSVTGAGTATETELSSVPSAAGSTVADSVYSALPPTSRLARSLIAPAPEAPQLDPGEAVHSQLACVSAGGNGSLTPAPTTSSGPAFATTIEYVTS